MGKALDKARKSLEIADMAVETVRADMFRLRELLEAEKFRMSKAQRMQINARNAILKAEKSERANRIRSDRKKAEAILAELGMVATPITLEGRRLFELNPAKHADWPRIDPILEIVGQTMTHSLVDPEELLETAEACREAAKETA